MYELKNTTSYENAIAERVNEYWNKNWEWQKNIKNIKLKKALIECHRNLLMIKTAFNPNHYAHAIQMHAQNKIEKETVQIKKLNNVTLFSLKYLKFPSFQ